MTLDCHTLTVVQMEFSNCGDRLLSVSRDRTWALHHFNYDTGKCVLTTMKIVYGEFLLLFIELIAELTTHGTGQTLPGSKPHPHPNP